MSTSPEPFRWYHIGPHGFFDLVRLARRGRTTLVRVAYLLVLFAVLYAVYERAERNEHRMAFRGKLRQRQLPPNALQESINHNARIAQAFGYTILISQCVAVLLLTPIYIAASAHEDRDRRALGILFTTQLSARAILQGKLIARLGQSAASFSPACPCSPWCSFGAASICP